VIFCLFVASLAWPAFGMAEATALPPESGIEPIECADVPYTQDEYTENLAGQLAALEQAGYGTGWEAVLYSFQKCSPDGLQNIEVRLFLPETWQVGSLGVRYYFSFYGQSDSFNLLEQVELTDDSPDNLFVGDEADVREQISKAETDERVKGFVQGLGASQARIDLDGNITYETIDQSSQIVLYFLTFGPSVLIDGQPTTWWYQAPGRLGDNPAFPELALVDDIQKDIETDYRGCELTAGYEDIGNDRHYTLFLEAAGGPESDDLLWTLYYYSSNHEVIDVSGCPKNVDVLIDYDGSGYSFIHNRYADLTSQVNLVVGDEPVAIRLVVWLGALGIVVALGLACLLMIQYIIKKKKQ